MSRPWTPEEVAQLGTKPDTQLARQLGRSAGVVWQKRIGLGIPVYQAAPPSWTEADDAAVLARPAVEAAKLLARPLQAIKARRRQLQRERGLPGGPGQMTCEEAKRRWEVSPYDSAAEEERVRFVGGPYAPPWVPIGGWLKCELRGEVQVGGYTNALIPWPTVKDHPRQLIYCGDLVKALKTESRLAVSFHFGICCQLVSTCRAWLGIERFNPGSARLFRRTIDLTRTAEAGAKRSRSHEGRKDLMSPSDRERLRAIQRKPKSEAWKQRMSERWKRRFALIGPPKPWTVEELKLIGTGPDREIAKRLGRSLSALKGKKFALLKALQEAGRPALLPVNEAVLNAMH